MTSRLTILGLLVGLLLTPLAFIAPAAQASWYNVMGNTHGGKLQLCKVPQGDGRVKIKVRLNNRAASHTHLGGISRTRDGKTHRINFRTGAGKVSATETLIRKPGDYLSAGMGETSGEGAGGDFMLSLVTRC